LFKEQHNGLVTNIKKVQILAVAAAILTEQDPDPGFENKTDPDSAFETGPHADLAFTIISSTTIVLFLKFELLCGI